MAKIKQLVSTFLRPDPSEECGYRLRYTVQHYSRHPDVCSWNSEDEIFICEREVEFDEPDFDVREVLLAQARGELDQLRNDFAVKEIKLEQRINELLAITFQEEK